MFFSSSSRLEGLLLSLMAKESFLHTFMAREPAEEQYVSQIDIWASMGPTVAARGKCRKNNQNFQFLQPGCSIFLAASWAYGEDIAGPGFVLFRNLRVLISSKRRVE